MDFEKIAEKITTFSSVIISIALAILLIYFVVKIVFL